MLSPGLRSRPSLSVAVTHDVLSVLPVAGTTVPAFVERRRCSSSKQVPAPLSPGLRSPPSLSVDASARAGGRAVGRLSPGLRSRPSLSARGAPICAAEQGCCPNYDSGFLERSWSLLTDATQECDRQ